MNSTIKFIREKIWPQRLRVQLVVLFSVLLGASMLTFIIYGIYGQSQHRAQTTRLQTQVLARNLAATSADYLLTRDYTSVEFSLLRAVQFPGILSIQVCDASGKLLGDVIQNTDGEIQPRYGQPPLDTPLKVNELIISEDNKMIVWQPVILGELLGWVKIQYSLQQISEEIRAVWGKNLIVGLVILIITGMLLAVFSRRPVSSIRTYTDFAKSLNESKGQKVAVMSSCLELKTLGIALNKASSRLSQQSSVINTAMVDLVRMAAFVEHAPSLILSMDHNGDIQYVNPCGYRMLSKLDVDEHNIKWVLPNHIEGLISKVIRTKAAISGVEAIYNGRILLWTLAPVRSQNIIHAYGEDITERKVAEENARNALVEKLSAVDANKAKSQFLANMSHELRTPLNAIIGYSEMLAEEAIDDGHDNLSPDLLKIKSAGKHLLVLINEILDLSKIEAGRMEVFIEEVDIGKLCNDVIATAQPLADKNNNRLQFHQLNVLDKIRSDSTKLRQILFNLISNATKFTKNGLITLKVHSEKLEDEDWTILEVHDSGIGMTETQLNHVFEPFAQADNSTTRKYGGTGLGLAITKKFCEMLGGNVTVTSKPNEGSTFTVRVHSMISDEVNNTTKNSTNPNPQRFNQTTPQLERRCNVATVLVIDDDASIRKTMQHNLSQQGFNVQTATNGSAGLMLAHKLQPAIITLDVSMPGIDGWTVLQKLKSDPTTKHIPVIMLTHQDEPELSSALGADDYLAKPVEWEILYVTIKKQVRKRNLNALLVSTHETTITKSVHTCLNQSGYSVSAIDIHQFHGESPTPSQSSLIVFDLTANIEQSLAHLKSISKTKLKDSVKMIAITTIALSEQELAYFSAPVQQIIIDAHLEPQSLQKEISSLLKFQRSHHQAA